MAARPAGIFQAGLIRPHRDGRGEAVAHQDHQELHDAAVERNPAQTRGVSFFFVDGWILMTFWEWFFFVWQTVPTQPLQACGLQR